MGFYARLIGTEDPKINAHAFPKTFADAVIPGTGISFSTVVSHWALSDLSNEVLQVVPANDKLAVGTGHTFNDADGVFLTATEALPAGLSATLIYRVVNSNPDVATLKVSQDSGGTPVDITDTGSGTIMLTRVESGLAHWADQRRSIVGSSTPDKRLRQMMWDEKAEGTIEQAEEGVGYTIVSEAETRLEEWVTWLSV